MFDRVSDGKGNVDAELLRSLPDEKLEEIAACATGVIQHCPECGELTAFPGQPTYNDRSECHNCDYETGA